MSNVIGLKDIINQVSTEWKGSLYGTKRQTASSLNVSIATVDNYRSMGLIESVKRGSKVYFSAEVVARVIRDGIDATGMRSYLKNSKKAA